LIPAQGTTQLDVELSCAYKQGLTLTNVAARFVGFVMTRVPIKSDQRQKTT